MGHATANPSLMKRDSDAYYALSKEDQAPAHTDRFTAFDRKVFADVVALGDNTPEAFELFDRVADDLSHYAYWYLLGTAWTLYTGWTDLARWRVRFFADRPFRADCLMKRFEQRHFVTLPKSLRAYRAVRPGENGFLALTLSVEVASFFFGQGERAGIRCYELPKSAALALILRRGERELIVDDRQCRLVAEGRPQFCIDGQRRPFLRPVGGTP